MPDIGNRLALESTEEQVLAIWADTRAGTEASGKQDLTQAIVAFSGGPVASSATIAGLGLRRPAGRRARAGAGRRLVWRRVRAS